MGSVKLHVPVALPVIIDCGGGRQTSLTKKYRTNSQMKSESPVEKRASLDKRKIMALKKGEVTLKVSRFTENVTIEVHVSRRTYTGNRRALSTNERSLT